MRILLVMAKNNYPNPEPDTTSFGQGMPYLAGVLKAAGHEVFGINMNHIWCHGSAPLTLERLLRQAIETYQPHLIGVSSLAPDYFFVRDVIFFSRKIAPDIPIVLGGGIVTYDPEYIFSHFRPDFAVIGEGEISIVKLAEHIDNKEEIGSVPSLVYWKNGKAVFNEVQYPENLDELPFPDYSPFDFQNYLSLNNQTNNYLAHTRRRPRIMPISIGRSCPFKCTFCCHYKGSRYRTRSISNVIKEIAYFYEKYHFNILYMHDELFSIKAEKAIEFCNKLKILRQDLKADFDWCCYLRVNDVDRDLLREMKDSGCKYIGYGFESASDVVLKSMKKGTTSEQILRALQLTQQAGIGIHANFIFGDVAETPETIRETIEFYNKYCRDLTVYFYYITPYPGSELFQHCLDKGLITDRQKYYETVAYNKRGVNMTKMSDGTFYRLTEPVMTDIFGDKSANILSCEKADVETCDRDAPFELRRSFYKIEVVCPHCSKKVDYLYPLRINPGRPIIPFIHSCVKCHKKFVIDVSKNVMRFQQGQDPYSMFYKEAPYSNYYPFDSAKHIMPSVSTPQLLESYKSYNIIRYANDVYAVAQALGSLDLTQLKEECLEKYKKDSMCFIRSSVAEVKSLVDKKMALMPKG